MTTTLAEATRGGVVESVHAGVVVAVDSTGEVVAHAGDPERFAYIRSSAKPFQAISLVESGAADRFGFTPAELALCCASHSAEPRHQLAVAAMLAKLGLSESALQCGAPLPIDQAESGRILAGITPKSSLHCDCSGKHTGMLATCLHLGYATENYLEPDHPLQVELRRIVGEVCRIDAADLALAIDGCSVPTFGAPLRAFATAYAALAAPERVSPEAGQRHAAAIDRLRAAMAAHPENVGGAGRLDTDLMCLSRGEIIAKSGAEGLICLAIPKEGLGVAIRVADGSFRAHPAIVVATLEQLGIGTPALRDAIVARHSPKIRNHKGIHVGDLRAAFTLVWDAAA
ncbi:MAG: asparaginase [Thermomicrobiales bacterium]